MMATTTQVPRFYFAAMGCRMLAALDAPGGGRLAEVPGWFAGWEAALSRFRPDSELCHLNAASGVPVPVSRPLWLVLQASLWAARVSEGLVVPTILPALELAGYNRPFDAIAAQTSADVLEAPTEPGIVPDWRAIRCDAHTRSVLLPAGVRLDLGGVAKGWAADRALRQLRDAGPALIDAGGDIAVSAPPRGSRGWAIGVANPREPDRELALLCLARGGVATSGSDYRRWRRAGHWQHHLIDPRTGRPADTDILSATVVAPSALEAEVAAKVALFLGQRAGLAWLDTRSHLAGLLVGPDGHVVTSRRWAQHLWR